MTFSKDMMTKKKLNVAEWKTVHERLARAERNIRQLHDSDYKNSMRLNKIEERNDNIKDFWKFTGLAVVVILAVFGTGCIINWFI